MAEHIGETITPELIAAIEAEAAIRHLCTWDAQAMIPAAAPTQAPAVLPTLPSREQIKRFEAMLLQMPQVETPTTHFFAPGLYARQMFIPKGTVLTGAVHKTEHLAIFVGDITVWTENGMKRLTGHHTFVSKPGAKRVGYAHADTWCTGFFPSDKTDVAELERDLVENPEQLQCNRPQITKENTPCLESQQVPR